MENYQSQEDDEPPVQSFPTGTGLNPAAGSASAPSSSSNNGQHESQQAQSSQHTTSSSYWSTEPPAPIPSIVRPDSPATALKKEKGRVRFNSNAAAGPNPFADPGAPQNPQLRPSPISRPKPSILHGDGVKDNAEVDLDTTPAATAAAQERARRIAAHVNRGSSSPNRISIDSEHSDRPSPGLHSFGESLDDIPLRDMSSRTGWQHVASSEAEKETIEDEAANLLRTHTVRRFGRSRQPKPSTDNPTIVEPVTQTDHETKELPLSQKNNAAYDGLYEVAAPKTTHGLLTEILNLYKPGESSSSGHMRGSSVGSASGGDWTPGTPGSPGTGTGTQGTGTPKRKWYDQNRSQETLINLVGASAKLANPNDHKGDKEGKGDKSEKGAKKGGKRPGMHKRTTSGNRLSALLTTRQAEEHHRVQVNISNILNCQDYIVKLCRALMLYGAPTHRLEEYLATSANFLEIAGQFLYLPGCMVISFDDKFTHTAEVRLVRTAQAIDLGKLKDVHHIYKEVIHDVISADEGRARLEDLYARKDKFNPWLRVLVHGFTSATAAVFSFGARPIDLPLLFCFGSLVGWLQLIVASRYSLYSNVFEISATVMVSFMARAFGSIEKNGEPIFCFSALAQGGIVMLLPGYSVLCSSLELQSRAIIPGSIRIVYAIIYSLFLGFGITVGALFYGLIDSNATSAETCSNTLHPFVGFAFVPGFVICICLLYQAKWRQMPVMVVVACAGYIVNYFSSKRFTIAPQIANTAGAFTVGVLANLYSRLRHGVAAATLIPAIFTQVPGGLASTGGLISGLQLANDVVSNSTGGESGIPAYSNTVVFNVAASMIQIAIGIAVGLFLSALVIYPLGKRRSGLFSF